MQIITADGRIRLFAHFTNSLPSLCKNVRKHWTCKMFVTCILSSVCLKLSIFSESSYVQYMALCDISLPNSLLVIMTIFLFHFIIIIKSEIRLISNYLGLGNKIIVIDLCLIVFSCLLIRSLLQSNGIKWEGIRFVVWHTLQWRHNRRDGFSNHQPRDCLSNRLFRQIKENIEAPRHWPLWGEFTGHRWIPLTKGQ